MALYLIEEEEAWKCPKHPSKKQRSGVCPACLRHRLGILCPNCANSRPCPCPCPCPSPAGSSSSSSFFSDGEPSLRRSRSVAIPFIRSGSLRSKSPSFVSVLKRSGTKKTKEKEEFSDHHSNMINIDIIDDNSESKSRIEDFSRMITRSRSVSTTTAATVFRRTEVGSSPAKWKWWNFPSPMKVFRSAKVMVQDRSPLHRG
ncbi:uncharacterized protein [Henckelia pumila]|uniref:uncharacterized protein n=1 Tax=Henckelia pumila TaxID=405737 RepID=UPI003C6E1210